MDNTESMVVRQAIAERIRIENDPFPLNWGACGAESSQADPAALRGHHG
jgi:hypothetical protein